MRIIVRVADGLPLPELGDSLANGTVIYTNPPDRHVGVEVETNDYDYMSFENDPAVATHRPEHIGYHPLGGEILNTTEDPEVMATFQHGDTFEMIGMTDEIRARGRYGAGVMVCIGDTGADRNHIAFDGIDYRGDNTDSHGHGTHVASTAASTWGIASDSVLYVKKLLAGPNGTGTEIDIAKGLQQLADYVVSQRAVAVLNLSLGGRASSTMDAAVQYVKQRGIWVCAAAGNGGADDIIGSPARVADFVIGAVDRNATIAVFSSGAGDWQEISFYMPGVDIMAAYAGMRDGQRLLSGTSMATPHATGVIAHLRAAGMDIATARTYIFSHLQGVTNPGRNQRGFLHVTADYGQAVVTPPPDNGGGNVSWQEDATGITEEVRHIVTNAQKTGWSTPDVQSQLGSIKNYMDQLDALFPKADGGTTPVDPPPATVDEDWANLLSGVQILTGQTKWLAGSTGIDLFCKRNTEVKAPHDGTMYVSYIPTLPGMVTGEMVLVYPDGRSVRFRHVQALVGSGAKVVKGQAVARVFDPSMDALHWPANYATPPDGYQHLDVSLATSQSQLNPTGGAGGNVNAYGHIYLRNGGLPNSKVIARTPGPPEGQSGT